MEIIFTNPKGKKKYTIFLKYINYQFLSINYILSHSNGFVNFIVVIIIFYYLFFAQFYYCLLKSMLLTLI